METVPLEITDLSRAPDYGDGVLSRWCKAVLFEARDEIFVRLTLAMAALMSVLMGALFATIHYTHISPWLAAAVYLPIWGWFTPPVILMLHNTMHRPFFRKAKALGLVQRYSMSFFFGVPTGFREHHLGVHHFEDNLPDDLSSTMAYQRDSFAHFLVYFSRLFFLGVVEVPLYLARNRRYKMSRMAVISELAHFAVIGLALAIDWRFGLVAFVVPYFSCRFMMMAGNWGQHAFLNTAAENSGMTNAITCINTTYNRRCFNDGYHIGHHLKANRHWTEMPADFLERRDLYVREGAIVFQGIDFFQVSLFLWTNRWDLLAKHYVRLDGKKRSDEDVIAMLKSRVNVIRSWPQESLRSAA
jgi:fatty acid desaturase